MHYCKIPGITKAKLAGLMLGVLASLAAGAANAADLPLSCTVINASTVQCGATTCIGDISIDSLGAIRCLAAPVCNLSAAPATITVGASSTLTASCPTATSYAWTGAGCAGKTASNCTASPTTTTGYTVAGSNANGSGSASVTVTVIPAELPPVCNPSSGADFALGRTRLSANCNPPGTSYAWSGGNGDCNAVTTNYCSIVTPTASTTYTVTATNSSGSVTKNLQVSVVGFSAPAPAPSDPAPTGIPVCTPSAGADFAGGRTRLTANCSPAGTSYAWSGGNNDCNGVTTNYCSIVTPTAASTTYSVTATNSYGFDTKPVTVTIVQPRPVCTLIAAPAAIGAAETSTLTATNCSPAATSYLWTGGNCAGTSAAASCSVTPATTTAYSVAGINGNGTGAVANATVTVAAPSCSVTASPLVAATDPLYVTTTLTASCNPAAATYTWTPATGLVAGTNTATLTLLKTALGTTTYSVKGHNGSGDGPVANVLVSVAMPSCSVTAAPATINQGSTATLTATCTPAASSYVWTGGTCAGTSAASCTVTTTTSTTAGNYNYSVKGTNAVGTGANSANATVTVTAVAANCTVIDVTWPHGAMSYLGTPTQTMNNGQMFAFRVTNMPSTPLERTELNYASVQHYLNISTSACDFTTGPENHGCASYGMNEPALYFSTTGDPIASCHINAGDTIYFNLKNAASLNGEDTCPVGTDCSYKLSW